MKKDERYLELAQHYANCLERHGDSHLGVDWPRENDLETRHRVMLEVLAHTPPKLLKRSKKVKLLDFGCGLSHMYDFLKREQLEKGIAYTGLDISPEFIRLSRKKYPSNRYLCQDVLKKGAKLGQFDFIIMNGLFTQKLGLSQAQMFNFLKKTISKLFPHAKHGVAFNIMSAHVDWKKNRAFHLGFDKLSSFLSKEVSRNFVIRHEYGLYEYTVYVYRDREGSVR